jgi:hypothetical protein
LTSRFTSYINQRDGESTNLLDLLLSPSKRNEKPARLLLVIKLMAGGCTQEEYKGSIRVWRKVFGLQCSQTFIIIRLSKCLCRGGQSDYTSEITPSNLEETLATKCSIGTDMVEDS